MPHPDDLFRQAEQLRRQADSIERHGHDAQRHLQAQDDTIRNLEQHRQEWQQKLHQIEIQLSTTQSASETDALNSQIRDITNRLRDMDAQIQTARNEKNRLLS